MCSVCKAPESPFRCRACHARYCCAACCQTHRSLCEGTAPAADGDRNVHSVHREKPVEYDEDGQLAVLSDEHLAALANDPSIRGALKSTELRELLRSIDGSRSRLDALAAAQHNVPEFREFSDEILRVVAHASQRQIS